MKYILYSPIPFLPFLLNYSANCQLRRLSILILAAGDPRYIALGRPPQKTPLRLLLHVDSLLQRLFTAPLRSNEHNADHIKHRFLFLPAFAYAGMCLLSRCLAMNYSGFQASCHNMEYTHVGCVAFTVTPEMCIRRP
jgi:hypothetical protein